MPDAGWVQVFITLLGVGGLGTFLRWFWKHTWYRDDNFRLTFLDHPPLPQIPTEPIEEPPSLKILSIGTHQLVLKVHARLGFKIQSVNLRCLNRDGSNLARNQIWLNDIQDYFYPMRRTPDGNWGVDAEYQDRDALVLARGGGIYLQIDLVVPEHMQGWSGLLSFRAQDDTGFRSYGRYALEIR